MYFGFRKNDVLFYLYSGCVRFTVIKVMVSIIDCSVIMPLRHGKM
jgi:hypothetical protein